MIVRILKISILLFFLSVNVFSQPFNDGPIEIKLKLREVNTIFDATDVGQNSTIASLATPDELSYILWARDNLGSAWIGGTCFTDDFTPAYNSGNGTNSIDFNSVFATLSYPTLVNPQFIDIKLDAWEDDNNSDAFTALSFVGITANTSGTRTLWDDYACQVSITIPFFGPLCLYSDGDDYRCLADPFKNGLDYRLGNPCEWYNHGNIQGDPSACVNASSDPSAPNTNGYYEPHIETYWRYTKGTSFLNAINLGLLPALPASLQHFNSNECYNNYYAARPGNDVIYSFDIANPTGVNISLCGINGAQFDSYLYLVDGTDTTTFITSNDNSCGGQSEIIESLCNIGTYYIVVDASLSSEFGTFTIEITKDPTNTFAVIDSISNFNGQDISCYGGSDGKFYAHINGGTPPYTFVWSNGLTHITNNYNDSITGLSAGTYSVIVSDSAGCTLPLLSATFVEPIPIVITTNSTAASCNGYADGIITVTNTSGGTPFYSYSWNSIPIQSGTNATGLSQGTYTVTVSDYNGCISTFQDIVTEPPPPTMSITSSNPLINSNPITYEACDGNNITLTASGLASYSWSPNVWLNTISGPTVISTPNPPGITYTCTGTDVSGCTIDIPIIVDVVSAVNIYTSNPSPQICEGEDIVVTFSGAASYSWAPPTYLNITNGATVTITPQDTITYTITAQNSGGCTDETTFFVDFLSAPTVNLSASNPAICPGGNATLSVSGSANTYLWSPSSSLNSNIGSLVNATPSTSTQYKVIGTASNGCRDSSYATININPLPLLNVIGSNITCEGQSVSLSVGGANTYIWSPSTGLDTTAGNTVSANPSLTQVYTIVGTDLNSCEGLINHTVSVSQNPNVSISTSEDSVCIGDIAVLTGNGALTYSWAPFVSLSNIFSVIPTTTTTYSVLGTASNGCASTSFITINVNPLPILSVSPTVTAICEGDSLGMIVSGAQDFIWSPALGLNTSIGSNVIATPITTSVYNITGTDINNCSDIISTTINVNPKPTIILSPLSANICEGASINISSFGANSYIWSPAFGLNSTTNSSVIANPNVTTNYTVLGTDFNNCTNITNFQLNVGINPTIAITPENPIICEGENISITASGANQYIWKPATTLSAGVGVMVNANPSISTTYTLVGTDAIGCVDSISTTISVNPLPSGAINQNIGATICRGDSAIILVDMSGNPPWNLTYSVNGVFQQKISATDNPALIFAYVQGNYTIPNVTDANGCSAIGSGSFMLNILNKPIASFDFYPQPADMLNPEITFTNNSILANSWYWDFGDGFSNVDDYNPLYAYFSEGTYNVSLIVMNGICSDTMKHTLIIDPVYTLYVPEVFTPNNDGLNDIFSPQGQGVAQFNMYIYNRWGEEIFYSNDINQGWSGKINNKAKIVAGYYSYVIYITDKLGVDHTVKGKVSLN